MKKSKQKLEASTDQLEIRKKAIDLLARREHSTCDLKRKLIGRNFAADQVDCVIVDLQEEGLLSDQRYAEELLRSRVNRGFGPVYIRTMLRDQNVAEPLIEGVLSQDDTDWLRLASVVRSKKFGAALPADYAERMRQARFLNSRGFESEHIMQILNGKF